ncbi:MAG TPA: helix-turn-helix transcriptional regulator [Kineosporiaceae bacterium]|jgi:transcriptional regulator with XRE-family HTH domain|nr:helix-turn-helix transcriptional regulator [Kineosporiaceae bacterium]
MALLRHLVGDSLRRARLEQGRTLRDVADAARVSLQYLSEIERGRKEASSEVLAAVCAALGWQVLDLLDAVRAELTGVSTDLALAPADLASRRLEPVDGRPAPPMHAQVRLAA